MSSRYFIQVMDAFPPKMLAQREQAVQYIPLKLKIYCEIGSTEIVLPKNYNLLDLLDQLQPPSMKRY